MTQAVGLVTLLCLLINKGSTLWNFLLGQKQNKAACCSFLSCSVQQLFPQEQRHPVSQNVGQRILLRVLQGQLRAWALVTTQAQPRRMTHSSGQTCDGEAEPQNSQHASPGQGQECGQRHRCISSWPSRRPPIHLSGLAKSRKELHLKVMLLVLFLWMGYQPATWQSCPATGPGHLRPSLWELMMLGGKG